MEAFMESDKRMTAEEAIERFVRDGDSFVIANCLTGMPLALVHELIRAGRRRLLLFQQGGIEEVDLLLAAGAIDRLVLAYNLRMGGRGASPPLERAMREGTVQVEEMTNFTLLAMLKAGAMGYPFLPVLSGLGATDVVRESGFLARERFAWAEDPFTGQKVLVVKGYQPDFALMHVQRSDPLGNGQLWGAMINSKWAALSAKKIILSAEKIVGSEVIRSAPHLTVAPAHKVCAVVECPWGAHPSELAGHYDHDLVFRALYFASLGRPETLRAWMDEWVYGVRDRREYLDHYVDVFGSETLERLRSKPFPSAPADYGYSFRPMWDDSGRSELLGMSLADFQSFLEQRSALIQD